MRESLSCNVELRRFGVWRAAIGVGAVCAIATVAAWALYSEGNLPGSARLIGGAVAAMLVAAALGVGRVEPGILALSAGQWHFTTFSAGSVPEDGRLGVALDLGAFLLLHFRADDPTGRGRHRWLPAQRRGLESDWHALRCAAYSPQRAVELP